MADEDLMDDELRQALALSMEQARPHACMTQFEPRPDLDSLACSKTLYPSPGGYSIDLPSLSKRSVCEATLQKRAVQDNSRDSAQVTAADIDDDEEPEPPPPQPLPVPVPQAPAATHPPAAEPVTMSDPEAAAAAQALSAILTQARASLGRFRSRLVIALPHEVSTAADVPWCTAEHCSPP